jgi:hypothetical protein
VHRPLRAGRGRAGGGRRLEVERVEAGGHAGRLGHGTLAADQPGEPGEALGVEARDRQGLRPGVLGEPELVQDLAAVAVEPGAGAQEPVGGGHARHRAVGEQAADQPLLERVQAAGPPDLGDDAVGGGSLGLVDRVEAGVPGGAQPREALPVGVGHEPLEAAQERRGEGGGVGRHARLPVVSRANIPRLG